MVFGLAEIVKSRSMPKPCRGITSEPAARLPVKVMVPLRSPGAVGENARNTRHLEPAASGLGSLGQSVLTIAKSPVVDIWVTAGPVPELITERTAAPLVAPMSTEPNPSVLGLTDSCGLPEGVTTPAPSSHVSLAKVLGETPALKPPNNTIRPSAES